MTTNIHNVLPDPVLTPIAMEAGTGGPFASSQLAVIRTVTADKYKYARWDFATPLTLDINSRRAPGDESNKAISPYLIWDDGLVVEHSMKDDLPDEIRNNSPNPAAVERHKVGSITHKLRLEEEIAVRDLCLSGSNPGGNITNQWDDEDDAAIEQDVDTAREAFVKQYGFEANIIVIPSLTAKVMKRSPEVRELRKYTDSTLLINGDLPPVLWGLRVVVPGAIVNEASAGLADSIARVWDKDKVLLAYVDPRAANDPTALTSIMIFRSTASTGTPWTARTWRDASPDRKTTWFHVETFRDIKIVAQCLYVMRQVLL